mmetsp:Transcript_121030/g.302023  ORF Transcript_121030/g.302023 Transcript_121030/m.302023 type:complete len:82 (-) Transcript_121030:1627-1872(-)
MGDGDHLFGQRSVMREKLGRLPEGLLWQVLPPGQDRGLGGAFASKSSFVLTNLSLSMAFPPKKAMMWLHFLTFGLSGKHIG